MLAKEGVRSVDASFIIDLCSECKSSLAQCKMPKFALKNGLYRGHLPVQFRDLTWVEESACSLYRTTSHVTRLFESTSDTLPRKFKGNTCAHQMNFLSTAESLPRAPADVNGMLSVVFVSQAKFDPSKIGDVFAVRKQKIWDFLLWLREHNILYRDIPLRQDIMDEYPENDILPGLAESVI
ncbi:hypothetical protein M422DRAFT_194002, partial [Sphaerobolus stellatus SS14]